METAFTILGLGVIDYIGCTVLQATKNQNKIPLLRVGVYMTAAILAIKDFMELYKYARAVFGV